jgi:hypothetical protein
MGPGTGLDLAIDLGVKLSKGKSRRMVDGQFWLKVKHKNNL